MSEQEVNSYRLTSLEEPSDEMLSYIMHEAATEANKKYDIALERFFDEIQEMCEQHGNKK